MKKYLIGFCFVAIAAASCRKVENSTVFDKTADQRLTESLAAYLSKLVGEANGWKGLVYTKTGSIFSFYFKFNDSNRVKMLSSFDSTSAVTLKESSYRLKALQQPSLLFDTYSYIHVLADPNGGVNGGQTGSGLKSDFEFYFDDAASTSETISLVGRFNGSKAVLTRATAAEAAAYARGELASALQLNKILTYYKRVVINGTDSADININLRSSIIAKTDSLGNLLDTNRKSSYYLSLGGLTLIKPLTVGTKTMSQVSNVNYNATTGTITATIDGSPAVIKPVATPLKVDVAAPARWWNYSVSQSDYWISSTGFHNNGKDDFFNWSSIPGYQYLLFWAKYGTSGGVNYDLLGPVVNNALNYGAAYRPPNFTADGRVIFTFFGTLGTVPSTANAIFVATRTQLAQAQGYYLVQTGPLEYDMVGALDGKAWITWQW